MKLPEKDLRELVAEWVHKGDEDMRVAEYLLEQNQGFSGAITFHCQQAAEKYLKALLTWYDIGFPKTHDLETLLILIEKKNRTMTAGLDRVAVLTPYGVSIRYPGEGPTATPADAREAVELARKVRQAVLPLLP